MHRRWYSENPVFLAGAAAVLCGVLFMGLTGAPSRLLLINLVALGVAASLVAIARLLPPPTPAARGAAQIASAAALLATALLGVASEGASRWILVGGLALQPGLILVPALLLAHVARPDRWSSLAIALAALAMAMQPDRSIAAAIAAVTLINAVRHRSAAAWLLVAISLAASGATQLRPDLLPAVPFVDQILWTSFAAQPLAATAVWAGTLLLFLPALSLWRRGQADTAIAFAALWGTLVLSAGLANYPTPLVGYGASCILGYLIVALALPGPASHARGQHLPLSSQSDSDNAPGAWRVRPTAL